MEYCRAESLPRFFKFVLLKFSYNYTSLLKFWVITTLSKTGMFMFSFT